MLRAMVLIAIPLLLASPSRAEVTVTVTKYNCQRLVAHKPAPDVDYRPGVDVRGRPVVPADVTDTPKITVPERFDIPVGIELDDRMGLGAGGKYKATMPVGMVTVDGGKVYYNGQLLADRDQSAIAAACRNLMSNPH